MKNLEFHLERAAPGYAEFTNGQQTVVITDSKKHPVLASKTLMGFQIDQVIAAHQRGDTVVKVDPIER